MKSLTILITALLMFGNINAQIVKEDSSGELKVDCWLLKENVEYDLQQYEINLNQSLELYPIDAVDVLELANFHLERSEKYSVIYSSICK